MRGAAFAALLGIIRGSFAALLLLGASWVSAAALLLRVLSSGGVLLWFLQCHSVGVAGAGSASVISPGGSSGAAASVLGVCCCSSPAAGGVFCVRITSGRVSALCRRAAFRRSLRPWVSVRRAADSVRTLCGVSHWSGRGVAAGVLGLLGAFRGAAGRGAFAMRGGVLSEARP